MTTQEKIKLRNKARADFEGKEYRCEIIFDVSFNFLDSGEIYFTLFNENMDNIYGFAHGHYDRTLKQCSKPFPKDGFSIYLNDELIFAGVNFLCRYISSHHECNFSCDLEEYPEVTVQQIKDEAKRILEL